MKFQKSRINRFILLIIVVGFSFSVFSGCGSLRPRIFAPMPDFPPKGDEYSEKYEVIKWDKVSDQTMYVYSGLVIKALKHDATVLRWIRKGSTTIGAGAALFGTGLHGAFKSDEDTLTMVAALSAFMPMLQNIWNAGGVSWAKEEGIKRIRNARIKFRKSCKDKISDKSTKYGLVLMNAIDASLTVVRNLTAKTMPSLDTLKTSIGEIDKAFSMRIVPDASEISMFDAKDMQTIKIINGRAINASTSDSSIVRIKNLPSIIDDGGDRIEIIGVETADADGVKTTNKGRAKVTIYDVRGESIDVSVKVGNTAPIARAGSYDPVKIDELVKLDGSASKDPDRDELVKFKWTLTPPSNSVAKLNNVNSPTPNFKADVAGEYEVSLTVYDASHPSEVKNVTITAEDPKATDSSNGDVDKPKKAGIINAEREISFKDPLNNLLNEFSGMAWRGNDLIILPQWNNKKALFAGKKYVYKVVKQDIVDFLNVDPGETQPIANYDKVTLDDTDFQEKLHEKGLKFDGFEAIQIIDNDVFMLVELDGNHGSVLIQGKWEGNEITISSDISGGIPPQMKLSGDSLEKFGGLQYESLVLVDTDTILVLNEVNFFNEELKKLLNAEDAEPHAWLLEKEGSGWNKRTININETFYRITDATASENNEFWVTNFNFKRDGLPQPPDDKREVAKLIRCKYDKTGGGKIVVVNEDSIKISFEEAMEYNWEAVVRLKTDNVDGFLVMNDSEPGGEIKIDGNHFDKNHLVFVPNSK